MRLKDFKDNKGLSYSELGRLLGISKSRAYHICHGTGGSVRVDEINSIANKTEGQVSPADLGVSLKRRQCA